MSDWALSETKHRLAEMTTYATDLGREKLELQRERDAARGVACSLLGYLWELWEVRGVPSAAELQLREGGHEWLRRP